MTLESKSSGTDPGLFETILGDGRPLLVLTGASLMFSGGFALFLSAGRQFLPQDLAFLGMTPAELCRLNGCRVLDFMIHDRVAFGGALIAIGSLFVWLAIFPLGEGEGWAWWTFILSGAIGFGSFLAYLGFGYLDTWHGVGTLLLFPVFALGLVRSRRLVAGVGPGVMLRPRAGPPWASQSGLGRGLMLVAAAGMTLGGFTILWVGVTRVFVSHASCPSWRTTARGLEERSARPASPPSSASGAGDRLEACGRCLSSRGQPHPSRRSVSTFSLVTSVRST
jgi:hypothetical protein